MSLIERAAEFAKKAHRNQKRKYTGEPYFNHCQEVAELVRSVGGDEAMIAAAYLHDVIEDCNFEFGDISSEFGDDVAILVDALSDVSVPTDGNRKVRKEIDRKHTAKAPPRAKTIKLADLISNSRSIVERDPDFAKVYLAEKRELLKVLTEGDPTLYAEASRLADTTFQVTSGGDDGTR